MSLRLRFWRKAHRLVESIRKSHPKFFNNKLYHFVEKNYEKVMHERFTNVPQGYDRYNSTGILEDPPGTPPEQISILPLEKVYNIPDED